MRNKIKEILKQNKSLFLLSFIIIVLFAWYAIRPSIIKHKCASWFLEGYPSSHKTAEYENCLHKNGI